VTERVDRETVFLPFHFAGRWQGVDISSYYPEGAKPLITGEAVNTAGTYGYDPVTNDAGNEDVGLPDREGSMRSARWPE
jgi:hypothetical protein